MQRDLAELTSAAPVTETHILFAGLATIGINPATPQSGWRLWGDARHWLSLTANRDIYEREIALHENGNISLPGGRRHHSDANPHGGNHPYCAPRAEQYPFEA